jgi:hypothetical protein
VPPGVSSVLVSVLCRALQHLLSCSSSLPSLLALRPSHSDVVPCARVLAQPPHEQPRVVTEDVDCSDLVKVVSDVNRGVADWSKLCSYLAEHPITSAELLVDLTSAWPPFLSVGWSLLSLLSCV